MHIFDSIIIKAWNLYAIFSSKVKKKDNLTQTSHTKYYKIE